MKSKLRGTARANVFRLSFPALRTFSGMELAGVLEGEREAGTDLYRLRVGGNKCNKIEGG